MFFLCIPQANHITWWTIRKKVMVVSSFQNSQQFSRFLCWRTQTTITDYNVHSLTSAFVIFELKFLLIKVNVINVQNITNNFRLSATEFLKSDRKNWGMLTQRQLTRFSSCGNICAGILPANVPTILRGPEGKWQVNHNINEMGTN